MTVFVIVSRSTGWSSTRIFSKPELAWAAIAATVLATQAGEFEVVPVEVEEDMPGAKPLLVGKYPKNPADDEWERLQAEATSPDQPHIITQLSDRKYAIGERRFIRVGEVVLPWVRLTDAWRYTWLKATAECERLLLQRRALLLKRQQKT